MGPLGRLKAPVDQQQTPAIRLGFGDGALGSLVLVLMKPVLVGITLGSHTKKKLRIVGGVLKPCCLTLPRLHWLDVSHRKSGPTFWEVWVGLVAAGAEVGNLELSWGVTHGQPPDTAVVSGIDTDAVFLWTKEVSKRACATWAT